MRHKLRLFSFKFANEIFGRLNPKAVVLLLCFFKRFERLTIALVNGIHRFFVELLIGLENGRVLADGFVNLGNSVSQRLLDPQMLIQLWIGQEIESVDFAMQSVESVDPAETLNESNWIPVEIVVQDVSCILQIKAFGKHIGGDQDLNGFAHLACRHIVRNRSKASDDTDQIGATTVGEFETSILFEQFFVEILAGVRELSEDQQFVLAQQRLFVQPCYQLLKFCILLGGDGIDEILDLFQRVDIALDVFLEPFAVEVYNIVLTAGGA